MEVPNCRLETYAQAIHGSNARVEKKLALATPLDYNGYILMRAMSNSYYAIRSLALWEIG